VKLAKRFFWNSILGFTMIELMIVVAIVAVLSAVAIPAYQSYIRRSYLNEATTSISAIKSAEESFYTINNCYVNATAWPTAVPSATSVAWDPAPATSAWARGALGVRPDRLVRFQYGVYASNDISSGLGCGSALTRPSSAALSSCVSDPTALTNAAIFGSNWYIVWAKGNLDGDSVNSMIVSAIDDSAVIMCNELE
jgi:prepilin-type N-terminal cleavage/methylation domain-containing protein